MLLTHHSKLLMHWKGRFEVKELKGGNNYQIKIIKKYGHFTLICRKKMFRGTAKRCPPHLAMVFQGGSRETRVGTGNEVQDAQGDKPQAAAVDGMGKVVV